MRKLALVVIVITTLSLAACAGEGDTSVPGGYVTSRDVELPDGTTVTCVIGSSGKGIDCDWGNR